MRYHPHSLHRAILATVALIRLGVNPNEAFDLVAYAIDVDPWCGVERVLLVVMTRLADAESRDAATVRAARETIDALSARCERLERSARQVERVRRRVRAARV